VPDVLPVPPKVALSVIADRSAERSGFLELRRLDLVIVKDGVQSKPFRYDMIDRRALDAAVMAAHHVSNGKVYVYLRSAIRPPIALRGKDEEDAASSSVLWELPAGLIEPGEAPDAAAARELDEELGFSVDVGDLSTLGHWMYPAPGFTGEKQFFFHVRVDAAARKLPPGDGSPIEEAAVVVSVPLDDALSACRGGEIRDAKTEVALRRLADVLRRAP
jgi:ADP-ribose pyrophosphatase